MSTLGATGDGRRATGDGRRATGDGRRATGDGHRTVLLAARSAVALYRLLDALPVFAGDDRVTRLFALVPGSDFGAGTLAAIEAVGGRTLPWAEAASGTYDLVMAASPKGELRLLRGRRVLLPHGAGFNKTIPGEGSADSVSGLDPAHLLPADDETPPVALHALAHPDQVARLAAADPRTARRAKAVGDPTLERILASGSLRDRYRAALGTGSRTLVALASTWGPESLLRTRPGLPAELAAQLPYDEYQLALIVHPNEHSLLGAYDLAQRLAPALDAGLVLAAPHEEWASVLVAADALITDHGSAALYYCAFRDRPIVGVHPGGGELLPGTPMDRLLGAVPRLGPAGTVRAALDTWTPGAGRAAAEAAFTDGHGTLSRLRTEVYALLGLTPPAPRATPRTLPVPAGPTRTPAAFDVHARLTGDDVHLTRSPVGTGPPGHHLAAESGAASEPALRGAGLLYRRALPSADTRDGAWTAGGWTLDALDHYPGCRTAAAVPASGACLLRMRGREQPWALEPEPRHEAGRIIRPDPAALLSAAPVWLLAHRDAPATPTRLTCHLGERPFTALLRPATPADTAQPL